MKRLALAITLGASLAPASAASVREIPAPVPYPFQRSILTDRLVAIPPYDEAFGVRVYSTPPQEPYYNVPPYAVVVPY